LGEEEGPHPIRLLKNLDRQGTFKEDIWKRRELQVESGKGEGEKKTVARSKKKGNRLALRGDVRQLIPFVLRKSS